MERMLTIARCIEGGLGMTTAGVLEFIIGNTFPFVVFFTFGIFWLSLGALVDPVHAVQMTLATEGTDYYGGPAFYVSAKLRRDPCHLRPRPVRDVN